MREEMHMNNSLLADLSTVVEEVYVGVELQRQSILKNILALTESENLMSPLPMAKPFNLSCTKSLWNIIRPLPVYDPVDPAEILIPYLLKECVDEPGHEDATVPFSWTLFLIKISNRSA